MILCPVCKRSADVLVAGAAFDSKARELIAALAPKWTDVEGICTRCIYAVEVSTRRLREQEARPKSTGFRGYARFYLNRRESGQWHHANPDIAKWRQRRTIERVSEEAERDRHAVWALFDCNEKLIAQASSIAE